MRKATPTTVPPAVSTRSPMARAAAAGEGGRTGAAAARRAELYEGGPAEDGAAGVLDEFAHGAGGAAGGEEVVADEDPGALPYRAGVGFAGVGAAREVVGGRDGRAGELVRFAGEDEALLCAVGEGRAENEAAGLGRE